MRISPAMYRRVAIASLVALVAIVVTGAAVRLTGSGLGCDDWPNCNAEKFIDVSSTHSAIEQINRLFTGIVVIAVAVAVLGSYVRRGRRSDLIGWSWMLVIGVFANALLGALTVWVDLHPYAVQGHMLLSMMLIASGTTLVRRSGERDGSTRTPVGLVLHRRLIYAMASGTVLAIITGTVVTGAGPHAGDENAVRLDVEISSVARVHGASVMLTLLIALVLAMKVRQASEGTALRAGLSRWIFVGIVQALVGYVQYFTGVPEMLVLAHVAGASAMAVVTTQLVLDTSRVQLESVPASQ